MDVLPVTLQFVCQGPEHLASGPMRNAPSCFAPLVAILQSPFLAATCSHGYSEAWHVAAAIADTRADDDEFLRQLAVERVLLRALQSPLWHAGVSKVRFLDR
jgi:hypothetical protein